MTFATAATREAGHFSIHGNLHLTRQVPYNHDVTLVSFLPSMCIHRLHRSTAHLVRRRDLAAAQPAVAADRCAHEIAGFLKCGRMRSRQLNGNPFGGFAVVLQYAL